MKVFTEKENRQRERFDRNIKRIAAMTLTTIKDQEPKMGEFTYFENILEDVFVNLKKYSNIKTIGSYCVMVPEELIYAFGYQPIRLCGSHYTAALVGEEHVPRDACPIVKASMGFTSMRNIPGCENSECVIVPLTCDCKRKFAEKLSEYLPVIPLPIKDIKDNDNFEFMVQTIEGLAKTLSYISGRKLSRSNLVKACKYVNEASKQAYILYQHLQSPHPVVSGSQVLMVVNSYAYANAKEWAEKAASLNEKIKELQKQVEEPKHQKPRIFIAGSPIGFPNYKLPFLLENLGAQIVGDESCLGGRMLYDPVVPNNYSINGIVRALAARYTAACTCPVFANIDDRLASLKEKVELTKADGIIYHVIRGCVPYDFEVAAIEEWAQREKIPVLRVETDFSAEDEEQIKIRFEAFIEMIERKGN